MAVSPPMIVLGTVVTAQLPVALASPPPHQWAPVVALDAGALLPPLDHEVRHGVSAVASARVMNHFFMFRGPPEVMEQMGCQALSACDVSVQRASHVQQ